MLVLLCLVALVVTYLEIKKHFIPKKLVKCLDLIPRNVNLENGVKIIEDISINVPYKLPTENILILWCITLTVKLPSNWS